MDLIISGTELKEWLFDKICFCAREQCDDEERRMFIHGQFCTAEDLLLKLHFDYKALTDDDIKRLKYQRQKLLGHRYKEMHLKDGTIL